MAKEYTFEELQKMGATPGVGQPANTQSSAPRSSWDSFKEGMKLGAKKVGGYFDTAKDVAVGQLKWGANTVKNISSIGERGLQAITSPITGVKPQEKTASERVITDKFTAPTNTAQKVGYYGSEVASYFVPIPALKAAKVGKLLSAKGAVTAATNVGKQVIDLAAKTAVNTGSREEVAKALPMGAVGGVVGEFVLPFAIKKALPGLSNFIEKHNFKLSPSQVARFEKDINNAAEATREYNMVGTAEQRYVKATRIYEKMEDQLEEALLTQANPAGVKIDKQLLLNELEQIKPFYKNKVGYGDIVNQIDKVKESISNTQADKIDLINVNQLKRSLFEKAYKQTGDKVISPLDYDMADVLRKNIEQAAESANNGAGLIVNGMKVGDFNKEYGKIIAARKLLKAGKNKKSFGLFPQVAGILIGGGVGATVGGPLGAAAGVAASSAVMETLAGSLTRSILSMGAENLSKLPPQELQQTITRLLVPLLTKSNNSANMEYNIDDLLNMQQQNQ